jgi:threonine dehydratase
MCRYPSSSAHRTASTHSGPFGICQTPRPTNGIALPSASTRPLPSAVSTSVDIASAIDSSKRSRSLCLFKLENVSPIGSFKGRGADYFVSGLERLDERLVTDGEPAAIAEGHGTIGVELLRAGTLDTVVVQVGDGALISGIARWVKEHSPETRVAGVCASGARAMRLSIDGGRPIRTEAPRTIAGGLAISEPVVASFDRVLALVGELVLVDDDDIRAAMVVIADTLGGLVEALGRRRRRRCPQAPFAG